MRNIFEQFRDYQSRNVDSPSYEPLKQGILIKTSEEEKKKKRNEYARQYYIKNKEKIIANQKKYRRRRYANSNHKWDMKWIQKQVYEYLLAQYHRWEDPARWTELAKALWVSENSIYTAVFHLTKKWYLWRWTYWRYLLLKFPEEKELKEEQKITYEDIESAHNTLSWKWYLDELADKINTWLIAQNKELYEENQNLKEQLQKIEEILNQITNK